MSNHTPGPWSYDPLDRVIIKEDVKDIAHMDRCATDADAYLISAAPEMLKALEVLVEKINNDEWFAEWNRIARAAIAKAKGEKNE